MSETNKEMFLSRRQEDYENQMSVHWETIKNITELVKWHTEIKTEIMANLRQTWINEMGSLRFPMDIQDNLPSRLDQTLDMLKIHFRSKLEADKEKHIPPKFSRPEPTTPTPIESTFTGSRTSFIPESTKSDDNNNSSGEYALGIDLGTTMCCVGVMYKNKVEIVQNRSQGNKNTTPSFVNFKEDGSGSYGYVAKEQAYRNPETTIFDAKRMIGRPWSDPNLQNDRKVWPFEIVEENGNPKVKIGDRTRYPHEISARLLSRLRAMAEESLHVKKGSIKKVVITVPAYFSEPQRKATKDAAECAGLQVLNILSEPTAAAIAYKWEKKLEGTRKALIYDLGGGTFDVSIAIVKPDNVDILCVQGDTHLGGQDFDQLLMEYCLEKFRNLTGVDIISERQSEDKRTQDAAKRALGRLRRQCEIVKERLSSSDFSMVDVDAFFGNEDLSVDVTREILENLCRPMIQKTLEIVRKALEDAKEKGIGGKEDIDDIILVGGSTRIPLVEQMVQDFFDGRVLCKHINPDEAVAFGAAIQAETLKLVQENENNEKVKSQNQLQTPEVQDVTPLTLGIECENDQFSKIIPRNTKIPFANTQQYCTSGDYQTQLEITVCQGESLKASDNLKLGEFIFKGIPASPAEMEKIRVTMTIDSMGILQVKAVCMTNGVENQITISSNQLGMKDNEKKELMEELSKL